MVLSSSWHDERHMKSSVEMIIVVQSCDIRIAQMAPYLRLCFEAGATVFTVHSCHKVTMMDVVHGCSCG